MSDTFTNTVNQANLILDYQQVSLICSVVKESVTIMGTLNGSIKMFKYTFSHFTTNSIDLC